MARRGGKSAAEPRQREKRDRVGAKFSRARVPGRDRGKTGRGRIVHGILPQRGVATLGETMLQQGNEAEQTLSVYSPSRK